MPRIDESTYAFTGKDENAANNRFNDWLDRGFSIPEAVAKVKDEFPNISESLVDWWTS